jgi:AcrR family transcriptional regulator
VTRHNARERGPGCGLYITDLSVSMSITFYSVSKCYPRTLFCTARKSSMGRPFTASDDEILGAAGKVMARRGPDGFSIAEVAADVGLSRAAIILRFKSTHALKVTLLARMVERFSAALQALPQTPSGDNVLRLAAFIGGYVRSRQSLAGFFSTYSINIQDPELLELELKRGQALRSAIASVMPEVAIDHACAVDAFSAHLTGTIMAWLAVDDDDDPRGFVVRRTTDWLGLAGVPYSEALVEELSAGPAEPESVKAGSQSRRRQKATRPVRRTQR